MSWIIGIAVVLAFVWFAWLTITVMALDDWREAASDRFHLARQDTVMLQGKIDSLAQENFSLGRQLNAEHAERTKQIKRLEQDLDNHRNRIARAFTEEV
jgi:hypothetical protein